MPILSILIFLPLIGAILLMAMPRSKDVETDTDLSETSSRKVGLNAVSMMAILFAFLNFVGAAYLFSTFNQNYANTDIAGIGRHLQLIEDHTWIKLGNIEVFYRLGIDGISLLLILLSTFITLLGVIYSAHTIKTRLKEFMVCLLILETAVIGVFCSLDLMLFYFFYEAALIPAYFLVGIFGSEKRVAAALKFFIFTFAGSLLMLVGIIAIYGATGTFNLIDLTNPNSSAAKALHGMDGRMLGFMFWAFAIAFLIKIHIFPLHTWLPDTYAEAPTAGTVVLSGVMLKMGTYGLIRLCLPLFPKQAQESIGIMVTIAIISIIYGAIIAAAQTDIKRWIAYSSMSHLGFILLGIFSFTKLGMMGALIQNINHGISTPMLFFLLGMLIERRKSRDFKDYGGLKLVVPVLSTFFLLAALSSIAVPLFNGFVGEFAILLGSWTSLSVGFVRTTIAATGMIFSAVYMLWGFQRIMLGPITKPANKLMPDLKPFEWAVLLPLTAMIFWIGMFSHFWTQRMDAPVETLMSQEGVGSTGDEDLPAVNAIQRATIRKYHEEHPNKPAPAQGEPEVFARPGGGTPSGGSPGGGGGSASPGTPPTGTAPAPTSSPRPNPLTIRPVDGTVTPVTPRPTQPANTEGKR